MFAASQHQREFDSGCEKSHKPWDVESNCLLKKLYILLAI